MDWLTFVSKLVESIAWPLVALILGLIFRERLHDLFAAIKKLKAGPVEAEFEIAVKRARADATGAIARDAPETLPAPTGQTGGPDPAIVSKLLGARSDPAGIILEAWAGVDGELFRLGRQMGLVIDPLENTAKVYKEVLSSNVLPLATAQLIHELRDLRNKVAHVEVKPTPESAQDYLLAVERVVELIRNYRKNLPNYGAGNR